MATNIGQLLQLLQSQQQAEERKEERSQDLALTLLSMEMRESESTKGILLKEYYDKKEQVAETEKMFDKYRAMDPDYKSSDGMNMLNIVDKQNKIDMSAITQNLNTLTTHQTELKNSLTELVSQGQQLKELQSEFWGANKMLQEGEYKEFQELATTPKTELFKLPSGEEVSGLGWATTAGADIDFYKMAPEAREDLAYKMTERYTKEAETKAGGSYAVLQSIFTPGKDEDTGDLVKRLTYTVDGKEKEPSENIISVIQSMAGQNVTYDDFLANLNAYPAESGGHLIREFLESNPNTAMAYGNLKQDARIIGTLSNELAGINESKQATDLENFIFSIADMTDKNAIFAHYDQAIKGKVINYGEDPFFDAVDAQLGGIDAGEEYMKYKGFVDPNAPEEDKNIGTLIPSQKELALRSLASVNEEIAADSTYMVEYDAITESLEKVQDYSYDRFLELAKIDPDNVDPWLLPSRARMVWWGMVSPSNDIEEEIARLGGDYRGAVGLAGQRPLSYPVERSLEENRAKRIEMEKTLQLLEGTD